MRRTWWVAASVVGLILLCGTVRADQINYKADLGGASEVPPVPGGATGAATATLDLATKTLTWTVDYSGLSGPATAAHIPTWTA